MTTSILPTAPTLCSAIDRARVAWLAGDPSAWARYQTYLRQLETQLAAPNRSPLDRRPQRPGVRA